MRGDFVTLLRLVLLGNRSLQEHSDLSLLTHEDILGASDKFTHLFVDVFDTVPIKKWRFLKEKKLKHKAVTIDEWKVSLYNLESLPIGFSMETVAQSDDDRLMSGFAGGGRLARLNVHFDKFLWVYEYATRHAPNADQLIPDDDYPKDVVWDDILILDHIYKVKYQEIESQLEQAEAGLREALKAIHSYASQSKEEHVRAWGPLFLSALKSLESGTIPRSTVEVFEIASGLDQRLKALLYAASSSWVFGGMGSWNDLGIEDESYQQVSDQLFNALHWVLEATSTDSLSKTVRQK